MFAYSVIIGFYLQLPNQICHKLDVMTFGWDFDIGSGSHTKIFYGLINKINIWVWSDIRVSELKCWGQPFLCSHFKSDVSVFLALFTARIVIPLL